MSLTIPEKTTVAIVGHSGSGKTTLCNLIARLWGVQSGSVNLGGRDVREYYSTKPVPVKLIRALLCSAFIRREKAKGHTVIMVGDGVNDSPALSEADAGIAISTGAAIAREIADITVSSEDLFALVTLRKLSEALMERIHGSYRFIVGFNLTLIALGVAGVLPPTTSALLHNGSTLGISLRNMTDLLDEENTRK